MSQNPTPLDKIKLLQKLGINLSTLAFYIGYSQNTVHTHLRNPDKVDKEMMGFYDQGLRRWLKDVKAVVES